MKWVVWETLGFISPAQKEIRRPLYCAYKKLSLRTEFLFSHCYKYFLSEFTRYSFLE
jgi:hypothetical protein